MMWCTIGERWDKTSSDGLLHGIKELREYKTADSENRHRLKRIGIMCERYGMSCRIIAHTVFITSFAGSWRFNYTKSKVLLYHSNTWGDRRKYDYHFQGNFADVIQAVSYIYRHDRWKYQGKTVRI